MVIKNARLKHVCVTHCDANNIILLSTNRVKQSVQ